MIHDNIGARDKHQ